MNKNMAHALADFAAAGRGVLSEVETLLLPATIDQVIDNTAKVGYDTGGQNWAFSAVAATLTIPMCQPQEVNNSDATIALLGYTASEYGVSIGVRCGGGPESVRYYDSEHLPPTGGRVFQDISPRVGDSLRIELFHDVEQGRDYGTVTTIRETPTGDLLTQRQVLTSPAEPSVVLRHASLAAYVDASNVNTPIDVRLWRYRDIQVTSRNGTHGTVLGPWSTTQFRVTTDGTPSGTVVADTILWRGGGTFGLRLRATS